ncbi:MAG: hypothetical protein PWP24_495 [Clostridiales bacterium]|nr:hypothetical protein [Clostridiales bacterium]
MIKLVCTDIDGTLVPDGTDQINPELFSVVKKLKEKGIIFVAASGRQYHSMKKLFAPVADDMIFIAEGGNLVMCREEEMAVSQMDKTVVAELIADIEAIEGCDAMVCGPMESYMRDQAEELIHLMTYGYHYRVKVVEDFTTVLEKQIIKVSLFSKEEKADELARAFLFPKWEKGRGIELVCAGSQWMDCINLGSNKGTAINRIQEIMKISPEETMVFGDNSNDIPMLRQAKYSFAVANAKQEVQDAVNYQADTYHRDGVLKELKKLLERMDME